MSLERLSPNQADVLEEMLSSEVWILMLEIIDARINDRLRQLRTGRLTPEDYIRVCESIREAEYLRERPNQMIREARVGTTHAR